jgi:aspartate/methionine/tyrosine aminotransferase
MTDFPAPVRPHVAALEGSRIRLVAEASVDRAGVIPLWYGESDRPTPSFIAEPAARAMAAGQTFYAPNRGIPELRAAIASYLAGLGRRAVTAERVSVTASGVSAIMLVMQALVDAGDNVVIVTPLWPNCQDAIEIMGGEARRVALTPGERGWTLDLDKLFAACDARTRAILVNSPGNPTGWLASADDIRAMLEFCRKRRIWLIADEVYERIVYDRKVAPSPLDLAGPDDPVISVNSFSKSWCMTGWRLGWLVTPAALGEQLGKINEFNVSCAPAFVQAGGLAAVTQGESFVAELVAQYGRARDMVIQRLQSLPRVRLTRPAAAFYAFFQVDGVSDSLALARRIVASTNVGLAPGVAFGPEGEGWLRLCFAISLPKLADALDRLAQELA